jgi:hypothetical protein
MTRPTVPDNICHSFPYYPGENYINLWREPLWTMFNPAFDAGSLQDLASAIQFVA